MISKPFMLRDILEIVGTIMLTLLLMHALVWLFVGCAMFVMWSVFSVNTYFIAERIALLLTPLILAVILPLNVTWKDIFGVLDIMKI